MKLESEKTLESESFSSDSDGRWNQNNVSIFSLFSLQINSMRLALKNSTIDKYFGFLIRLDNISKKRLIAKLVKSIDHKEKKNIDLKSLFGAWEDSKSSDEIINDIKESRVEKSNSLDF